MTPIPALPGFSKDRAGQVYDERSEGVHVAIIPEMVMRGANLKRAFILRQHVEAFVKYWGRNHTLFFTTTDSEGVGPKEYGRRWHSLMSHESDWLDGYLRVLEPQRSGRPHFHNLTAVEWDTQPDAFNWEAFASAQEAYQRKDWITFRTMRAAYVQSAAPQLRELWAWARRVMPRYGLGRSEILPVRKDGAISEYMGKYLDKGMAIKVDGWKGVRRFETDRRTAKEWKRCGSKFSWVGYKLCKVTGQYVATGAWKWRARVGQLAFALGLPDDGDIKAIGKVLGPKWAYRLRGAILTAPQAEWVLLLNSLSHEYNPRYAGREPEVEYDNGENAAW